MTLTKEIHPTGGEIATGVRSPTGEARRGVSKLAMMLLAGTLAFGTPKESHADGVQLADASEVVTPVSGTDAPSESISLFAEGELKTMPSVDLLTSFHPEIPYEVIEAFVNTFNDLKSDSPKIASEFEATFLGMTLEERAFVFKIYASSYTSPEAESPKKIKILWKNSVAIVDMEENISYSLSHNGEMREGDSFEIIGALDTLFKRFPNTRSAVTNDDLLRIQGKYIALRDLYAAQSAEAKAQGAIYDAQSAEAKAQGAIYDAQSAEAIERTNQIRKQIDFIQSLIDIVS